METRENIPIEGEILTEDENEERKEETKKKERKPRKEKKPRVKLDEPRLINPSVGIKRLYLDTKDFAPTGNPVKDLKSLMSIYQSWHFALMPKIEFKYFLDRIGKLGAKDAVKVYMGRLRQVYKGLLEFSSFEEPTAEPKPTSAPEEKKEPEKVAPKKVQQTEEDAELENALQINEDAGDIDFEDDEYFGGIEAAKVRIDEGMDIEEGINKKRAAVDEYDKSNEKKYKLDNTLDI